WEPKRQRPELWNVYNGRIRKGENVRVFPISNWTEQDVWNYIQREQIAIPEIYFAHERDCIVRNGRLMAASPYLNMDEEDIVQKRKVRFRTVGDITGTAAVESDADTLETISAEIEQSKISERGAR